MAEYKTENGFRFPKAAFAYTPTDTPSDWKLRLWETPDTKITARQVGMAVAALGKGFRGNKVQIPASDLPAVKRKVRAAWRAANPDKSADELPTVLKASALWLQALAVTFPATDLQHPNRTPFEGILTRVDEPSTRPPGGAHGHRVQIPRAVADAALPSLLGMGVDLTPSLRDHDRQHKVGVITEAWLDGRDLRVRGFLYARDFAEDVARVRRLSAQGKLGMSYEVTDVEVTDPTATIWMVESLIFTGAAILQRDAAAYSHTYVLAAHRAAHAGDRAMTLSATDTGVITTPTLETMTASILQAMDEMQERMAQMMERMRAMTEVYDRLEGMRGMIDGACDAMGRLAKMSAEATTTEQDAGTRGHGDAATTRTTLADDPAWQALAAEVKTMGSALATIQAQLLTDNAQRPRGLVTDQDAQPAPGALVTDTMGRPANGGPVRTTLKAGGEYEAAKVEFAEKFTQDKQTTADPAWAAYCAANGLELGKSYTIAEVDALIKQRGITDLYARGELKNRLAEHNQLS